ncbi:hypothetical protein B1C81_29490 [Streptomyces sp. HG99]|nr:hypothetical protein B1C81_29490 [Streptomyces sp. HG99]
MTQYYLGAFGCTSTPRARPQRRGAGAAVPTDRLQAPHPHHRPHGVAAAEKPTLRTQLLWDTEPGYDHAVVEVHTTGADDWTTLPEAGGATSTTVPTECEAGFLVNEHPSLKRYLTVSATGCANTGTTGSWNSFTGAANGWQQADFDLSAYVGKSIEVSLSYITDPSSGGHGVLADEASLVVGGAATETEGFETSLGPWSVPGPPAGPGRPQGLGAPRRALQDIRRGHHGRHRAAGLRPGARHRGRRPRGAHREGSQGS